jgi:hypothetical protein
MIAKKNVNVYDEEMGIHRQVIAGQAVPPDLLDAYAEETGEKIDRSGVDGAVSSVDAAKAADEQTAKAREADEKDRAARVAARAPRAAKPADTKSG